MMLQVYLVMLLGFFSTSVMAQGNAAIQLDHNFQRSGGDYTHFYTANVQQCAEKCEGSARCRAFDFHLSDRSCWLKNRVYRPVKRMGVISGAKQPKYSGGNREKVSSEMSIRRDTQRMGGNYRQFRVKNSQQCSRKCMNDPRCAAFDYTMVENICFLKSWVPPPRRHRGIISGVKKQFYPQVQAVQRRLIERYYNPGAADGLMGRKTRIALNKFQRDQRLLITGEIDDATLVALGLLRPFAQVGEKTGKNPTIYEEQPIQQETIREASVLPIQKEEPVVRQGQKEDLLLYVTTIGVAYLQAGNTIYADILAKIPAGTKLQVISESQEWYKVSFQNQVGFVLAESADRK